MKSGRIVVMVAMFSFGLAVTQACAAPAIGAYYDAGAYQSAAHVAPYVPFRVFIVLTDSPVASVEGLRIGYAVLPLTGVPNTVYRLSQSLFGATGTVSGDALSGAYDLVWEAPRSAGQSLVMLTWDLMLTNAAQVEIWLSNLANSGNNEGLPEIAGAGTWHEVPVSFACGVGAGSGWPSAMVNYNCPIAVEGSAWGGVKALYR
jgi:hypothetical protein